MGRQLEVRPGWQLALAAERAVDAVLADSFPASDPPSWTPSHASTNSARQVLSDLQPITRSRRPRWVEHVASIAGAIGIVLLSPLFIVGLPIALAWRAVLDLRGWPDSVSSGANS
jgi:hypothetical protein